MIIDLFTLPFMQMALLSALILAGIHAYLGFHIVSRGVIFVDLSLAQAAAFGSIVALVAGVEQHTVGSYFVSLLFTLIGAAIISVARTKDDRIPQEAFIGIVYAGFSAGVILLLAHRPEGTEELQHMLAGSLLTVSPVELVKIAVLYLAVGLFHWVFRRKFFAITQDRKAAKEEGISIGLWDFLFYATFGIVVTSSVEIAGVLMVFSLLVIPPVIALLITQNGSLRLALGWVIAIIATFFGLLVSLGLDMPAGPSIISSLTTILILTVFGRKLVLRKA